MNVFGMLTMAQAFNVMVPSKKDWEEKIEQVMVDYKKAALLPRKSKKRLRKKLLIKYKLFCWSRDYSFDIFDN